MKSWYTLLRVRGVPLRGHWSAFLMLLILGNKHLDRWLLAAATVLIHELGHAAIVRLSGAEVLTIDLHGFGGFCRWRGNVTPIQRAAIAWGGVLAQGVLIAALFVVAAILRPAPLSELDGALSVIFLFNFAMIFLNLLPVKPLDGSEAWPLFPRLARAAFARRSAPSPMKKRDVSHLRVVERDDDDEKPGRMLH